ncbi:MAG: hypothetical protein ACXAC7_09815 [Candidatus Hodarchaeales archaeon]|jgi:hypothetical protein
MITVQLDNKTKQDLLIVKAQLEQQSGKKNTLEEVVKWLIKKANSPSLEDRIRASEECFGLLKDLNISLDDVTRLRREGIL